MMYKNLNEKYSRLEKQAQGIVRDAQTEISGTIHFFFVGLFSGVM